MARWAVVLWLLLAPCVRAGAQAATNASLSWVRVAGTEHCISAPELAQAVESLVGHPVWVSPVDADISVEGHVRPAAEGGFTARIVTAKPNGEILGTREVTSPSVDCRELDEPLSLVVALTVDPESGFVALPALFDQHAEGHEQELLQVEAPFSGEAVDATGAAAPSAGTARGRSTATRERGEPAGEPERGDRPPQPPAPAPERGRGGYLAAGGGGGQTPKLTAGISLGWLGSRQGLPVGLTARLWLPREQQLAPEAGDDGSAAARDYRFWNSQLALFGCPLWHVSKRRPLEGHFCLGAATGVTVVRGPGGERTTGVDLDVEILGQVIFPAGEEISAFFEAGIAGVVLGARYGQELDGDQTQSLWETPVARGFVSAGVFFRR